MVDRTTKLVLAAIALGLWANVFVSAIPAARADVEDDIGRMANDIRGLVNGICLNPKLC
jgi:hypothetical protein